MEPFFLHHLTSSVYGPRANERIKNLTKSWFFLLVKIQKDSDGDRSFKNEDREYCYKKIGLTDLTVGKAIELK